VDSVEVASGNAPTGVDFPLFDPVAIAGTVVYVGTAHQDKLLTDTFYVYVYDTAGFDPDTSSVQYKTDGGPIALMPRYAMSSLSDAGLQPGTYFVGAFMDVNFNRDYDPDVDPAGWYGGGEEPSSEVTVENGADMPNVDIVLEDASGSPFLGAWRQTQGTPPDGDARARFRAHISRIVEQLNREK
jgi:hypothetical protein